MTEENRPNAEDLPAQLGNDSASDKVDSAKLLADLKAVNIESQKTLADLQAVNAPRVRWSYMSQNLSRVMYVYLSKLSPAQMAEYSTAEEIITRLAHSIEDEERRVVRKERDE